MIMMINRIGTVISEIVFVIVVDDNKNKSFEKLYFSANGCTLKRK